jgi:hypothetical protein
MEVLPQSTHHGLPAYLVPVVEKFANWIQDRILSLHPKQRNAEIVGAKQSELGL